MNVAVVGAGHAGKVHLTALREMRNVAVKAVCDVNPSITKRVAARWKIKPYTDITNMLDNEDLDMVAICTPPNTHCSISLKAINAGVHVLVEKPLTDNSKDAKLILEALSGKREVKLGVVHNLLFSKAVSKGKKLFEKGSIGRLMSMFVVRTNPIKLDIMASYKEHWSHKLPGGRVCEGLPHLVYLVQEFDEDVKVDYISAKKLGSLPWLSFDELHVMLESNSGQVSIYWSRNIGKTEFLILLFGTEGLLGMNLMSNAVVKTRHFPTAERIAPCLDVGLGMLSEVCQSISALALSTVDYLFKRSGWFVTRKDCIQSFIDSIVNGTEPYVNAKKGYACTKIATEICDHLEKLRQKTETGE